VMSSRFRILENITKAVLEPNLTEVDTTRWGGLLASSTGIQNLAAYCLAWCAHFAGLGSPCTVAT
jgi:hypothetical protein